MFGVLSDIMRGRPVLYATFASYDEVAHHSGLERADTLQALRELDQQRVLSPLLVAAVGISVVKGVTKLL